MSKHDIGKPWDNPQERAYESRLIRIALLVVAITLAFLAWFCFSGTAHAQQALNDHVISADGKGGSYSGIYTGTTTRVTPNAAYALWRSLVGIFSDLTWNDFIDGGAFLGDGKSQYNSSLAGSRAEVDRNGNR